MFEFKPRVRKPTQSQTDCTKRLMFMLDMHEHWYDAVHGFVDQGEFPIPLCQRVRRGEVRTTGRVEWAQSEGNWKSLKSSYPHLPKVRGGRVVQSGHFQSCTFRKSELHFQPERHSRNAAKHYRIPYRAP